MIVRQIRAAVTHSNIESAETSQKNNKRGRDPESKAAATGDSAEGCSYGDDSGIPRVRTRRFDERAG